MFTLKYFILMSFSQTVIILIFPYRLGNPGFHLSDGEYTKITEQIDIFDASTRISIQVEFIVAGSG